MSLLPPSPDSRLQFVFDFIERLLLQKTLGGKNTITWPGGSTFSNNTTIPHGLPVAPKQAQGTAELPAGAFAFDVHVVSIDATNIVFRGHTTDGTSPVNPSPRGFWWSASL